LDLQEKTQIITEVMKQTKEQWVRTKPENTDIAIYLHFFRGDDLVITLQCEVDRDKAMAAGEIGAMGFGADTMAITFESFHSNEGKSPLTGKQWRPHEMQYVFEAEPRNAVEHWVDECITTTAHERGGAFVLSSNGYRIMKSKTVWMVEWTEQQMHISSETEEGQAAGVMFEYLQHSMANQTIEEKIAEDAKSNPLSAVMGQMLVDEPERRLFHTDMATITALNDRKLIQTALVAAEPGSVREELLTERLGNDGTWNVSRV
jgi:hypothetical protein